MRNKTKIYLDAPNIGNIEKDFLCEAIDSTFISTVGPYVAKFEEEFAKYIGIEKAISTQSGTAAIHIALHELGIGKGDEVIVPALTFVATVNPILYVGARPVFVDVNINTWNISPLEIEKNITKKTKAIIPVHLYGNPCNMDEIIKISKEYNLHVIEDATESMGSIYKGRQTGTFGDIGCFSFNGNKIITTGGGGMIVTNDDNSAEHIKYLVNQARNSNEYYHSEMGFNYRMTNIEAALGLAQMERIKTFLDKKRKFAQIYRQELSGISDIKFQREDKNAKSNFWLTCAITDDDKRLNNLFRVCKEKNIPVRRIFMPLGEMPYLKAFAKGCPNAQEVYKKGICLPSSTLNSEEDIKKVALIIGGI
jgi:perosamine synthetase